MVSRRYKAQRRFRPKRSRLKQIVKNRFFWFGILGFLFMGGIVYGIFFTSFFKIEHIEISGNAKIPEESLREIAQTHLPRKFMFLEMNHFFLANTSAAAEAVKAAFPEVETAVVQRKFPDSVLVVVRERQGIASWCQQRGYTVEVSDGEEVKRSVRQCFALDAHGVIFEEKEPERELIISEEGKSATLGEEAIDPELLKAILSFGQQLDASSLFREVGLRVSSAVLVSKERVNVKISEGWHIYLNPTENIDWQVTKVKLVLEKEIPSGKRPFLEYIDLRFGDQAYIKYR